ncbi:MAG: hypothetical protein KDD83_01380 [Caldilineaceae bacterium]|nr:hypothetical protein [Caldilineaceae bacterium]
MTDGKVSIKRASFRTSLGVLAFAIALIVLWPRTVRAASPGDVADTYLTEEQAALLDEMLDTHLNYFIAAGPITGHGLPLTAYKPDNPEVYGHSTPAEWGYALQAWIAAWERGKLSAPAATGRIDQALTTISRLQADPAQNYEGLFYPFYLLLFPNGAERPSPVHDVDDRIPSGDNAILYQSLGVVAGYLRDHDAAALADKADAIRQKMDFSPFVVRDGADVYLNHLVHASSGAVGDFRWDVYADEGGLVTWVAFISRAISWDEYRTATELQMRNAASWTSPCTARTYVAEEAPWFNAMFTWGSRSLHGFPSGDFDAPAGTASQYAAKSFAPAVDAHLDYGTCVLGVDYPITSDSPSQADGGIGLTGRYTPPNLSDQATTEAPAHIATHGPFVPFNIGPALSTETLTALIAMIESLKTDTAGYYHATGDHPYGFEVIASPFHNNNAYAGADQGRGVFETLNQAFIVLSLFNGLQLQDGKETLSAYAAQAPEHELAMQQALQYLYPTPADPWCVVGDYTFASRLTEDDPVIHPEQQDIRIRADCVKPGSNTILLEAKLPAKAYRWLVWDSLALTTVQRDPIWLLGSNEAPPDYTSAAFDEFDDRLPFNIDFDVESMGAGEFPFQLNDNALPQIFITFDLTAAEAAQDLILNLDTLYATHDDVDSFTLRVQVNGADKTYTWPSVRPGPNWNNKPLILLYAVLDNNLGALGDTLVNNVEMGMTENAQVRLMVDEHGPDNAFVYEPLNGRDSGCLNAEIRQCGYVEGVNMWPFFTENTAHPNSLVQFIRDSLLKYPDPKQLIVVLIGHGSGWGANVLPEQEPPLIWPQPSGWRDQNGGMLWDDTPEDGTNTSLSLSTAALGQTMRAAGAQIGRPLDLLYLDACDMAMAEVAYELRGSVSHLLASPNVAWATFNYDNLLPLVNAERSGGELGGLWLQAEADLLDAHPDHPYTFSLLNLDKMDGVAAAASSLADALLGDMAAARPLVVNAHEASAKYDSDFDGDIDVFDSYTDLLDFVEHLQNDDAAGAGIRTAAEQVVVAVSEVVSQTAFLGGTPLPYPGQIWDWDRFGGLSVYLPVAADEARRKLYGPASLAWAADTSWDAFLGTFWGDSAPPPQSKCGSTTEECEGLAPRLGLGDQPEQVFLPLIVRR